MMDNLLFQSVDVADYPQLAGRETIGERPGLVVLEGECFRYLRVTSIGNVFFTPLWWGYHRRKMSINDRALYRFHHTFLRTSSHATNLGFTLGLLSAVYKVSQYEDMKRVVNEAVALRTDKLNDRWNSTSGRGMVIGGMTTMQLSAEGNVWMRFSRGIGIGILFASLASFTQFDVAMGYLMS